MGIYLDYNASAPIDMRVVDSMVDAYNFFLAMLIAEHMTLEIMQEKPWMKQEQALRV